MEKSSVRGQSSGNRYTLRMRDVLDYISQNLDHELSLDQLASVANFSPFHFHRQFSSYTGTSVASLVKLLRLRRASLRLAFVPTMSVTDIAHEASYQSGEAFSRAFKRVHGQTPTEFRRDPQWQRWQREYPELLVPVQTRPTVSIVDFPRVRVAAVEYLGPEQQVFSATRKLIEWRRENKVPSSAGCTYGVVYSDPVSADPEMYRFDVCVSYDKEIAPNTRDVISKVIPPGRCALVRHNGSRDKIPAVDYLYREWLPDSQETLRDYPVFFHYLNVGPDVSDEDMITDVYLPIQPRDV